MNTEELIQDFKRMQAENVRAIVAAHAMQAIVSKFTYASDMQDHADNIAKTAVALADALMAELKA